jgi:hypothetical protein
MYAIASNVVSVLRGTTTNAYGDEVDDPDNAQVVASGIPAQIVVTSARAYDPTSQQLRVIQTIAGVVQSDVDIVESDQLIDDRTGVIYTVESVTQEGGPGFTSDLELVLRRVT